MTDNKESKMKRFVIIFISLIVGYALYWCCLLYTSIFVKRLKVCRKLHQNLLGKGSVPCLYLLFSRRMTAREMEGVVVVLQEERGEVSQGVLLTKKSPHTILIIGVAMVELHGFQFRKLLNQRLVNHQPLISVPSRRLVFRCV